MTWYKTAAEVKQEKIDSQWNRIRKERNRLLKESDWAILPDAPITQTQLEMAKAYRQDLRDLPNTYDNPDDVRWPETPDFI